MFEDRLEALASQLDAVRLVALIAGDGIPVEAYVADDTIDVDALAAELITLVRSISRQHGDLALGGVKQLSVLTGEWIIMIGALAAGHYLLLVLEKEASIGRARFELRRAPLAFDSDLE
jgi:predicted regulator of Ras-like GTPase activity (Roadblock/LC7/MglB family)